jgi:hypothetical protein
VAQWEATPSGRRQTRLPVEAIEKTLEILIIERQRLHEQDANREPLEANRQAILYWQRELAQARRRQQMADDAAFEPSSD